MFSLKFVLKYILLSGKAQKPERNLNKLEYFFTNLTENKKRAFECCTFSFTFFCCNNKNSSGETVKKTHLIRCNIIAFCYQIPLPSRQSFKPDANCAVKRNCVRKKQKSRQTVNLPEVLRNFPKKLINFLIRRSEVVFGQGLQIINSFLLNKKSRKKNLKAKWTDLKSPSLHHFPRHQQNFWVWKQMMIMLILCDKSVKVCF